MKDTARILNQDTIWVDRNGRTYYLASMDPRYRSNLIPFLRGNANVLQQISEGLYFESSLANAVDPSDGVLDAMDAMEGSFLAPAEEWLEQTPLMRRLVALEQGVPYLTRMAWAAKNRAYKVRHGYKKIRTNK